MVLDGWTQVRRDLAAFCDLGTELVTHDYPSHLEFSLRRNGAAIDGEIRGRSGRDTVVTLDDEPEPVPYASFLASERMGNLRRLASQTTLLEGVYRRRSRRELTNRRRSIALYDCFVPQHLRIEGRLSRGTGLDALRELVSAADGHAGTRIIFLAAQAGQGKSSLLDVFTVHQARRYLERADDRLCLYVDAQGRGLARLDEAIARQLNDLQFMVSYSAVVSLVREGLITLIVDGFDELIGSRGTYEDAFGSLSNFIEILAGRGTIVAATRSSYFTQEYGSRGSLLDADDEFAYELLLTEVVEWDRGAQREYFTRVVAQAQLRDASLRRARSSFTRLQKADDANLLSRPLFARDLSLLVVDDWSLEDSDRIATTPQLVDVLARSYLDRETSTKLLTRDRSRILTVEQLTQYYAEVADEMWTLEARELDTRTLRELLDLLIDEWAVSVEGGDILRARHAALPFIAMNSTSRTISFEHEVFFSYFLAKTLGRELWDPRVAVAQVLLSKAALDTVAADFVAAEMLTTAAGPTDAFARVCEIASARHPREQQIRLNCGSIVASLLRARSGTAGGTIEVSAMSSLVFAGLDLSGLSVSIGELYDVEFSRCDLRNTTLTAERSDRVLLRDPILDPATTRIGLEGFEPAVDLQGMRVVENDAVRAEYDAARVAEVLESIGLAEREEVCPLYEVDDAVVARVTAVAAAFERANPIGTKHDRFGHLFTSKGAHAVIRLLEEHGLIVPVSRGVRGPAQTFYRKQFSPAMLMEGLWQRTENPLIDDFWRAAANLQLRGSTHDDSTPKQ